MANTIVDISHTHTQEETYRIVSKCSEISINSLGQLPSSYQCRGKIDVAINKLWFESDSMVVVVQCLL